MLHHYLRNDVMNTLTCSVVRITAAISKFFVREVGSFYSLKSVFTDA